MFNSRTKQKVWELFVIVRIIWLALKIKKLLLEIFKAELPHPVDTCVFALNLIALSRICIWEWTKGLQVVYYYQNAFEV